MNILARVHLYAPDHCAGAEMMLHELLKSLIARGHRCQVHLSRFSVTRSPYVLDGVEVYPRGSEVDWTVSAADADVLMTHLDNTSTVISASIALGKPLVQVLHNTHAPTRMWANCRNDLLVYNSEWMRIDLGDDPNGVVVRPPVRVADYEIPDHTGRKVTLVNLNQAKGGVILAQLAALMPEVEFLGVHGAYGEQLDPKLPNVEIQQHTPDMRSVYRDTRILLMPSTYESWGRVGIEAMCSGIPVIATGTPGLREALGSAGVFMQPDDSVIAWQHALQLLLTDVWTYELRSRLSTLRAAELDPTSELDNFCKRVEALL